MLSRVNRYTVFVIRFTNVPGIGLVEICFNTPSTKPQNGGIKTKTVIK